MIGIDVVQANSSVPYPHFTRSRPRQVHFDQLHDLRPAGPLDTNSTGHTPLTPFAEAMTWARPGVRNRELLNLCQAVPSYSPADSLRSEIARLAHDPATHLYT